MTQADKAQRFRRLHDRSELLLLPNPWDAGTAKILEALGYEAMTTTSAGLAWTLGRTDGTRSVSRDEALANAASIVDATSLPVAADLENGYGDDPSTVAQTIRLAAQAGLVGASIEDASGDPHQPIYAFDHAVERVAAAAKAARELPFPFVLVARAENYLHGVDDLDDTIRRLQEYEAAGADVLYAPLLPDADAIRRVCESVTKPVNVLAAGAVLSMSVRDLAALGVRRISVGSGFARAAFGAFTQAAREMREAGSFETIRTSMTSAEITKLAAG
ncbi:MAG TPA: isocitrate lyase/phosphoenolpyruvate mutase family protein [Candidatus Baltobacteraceae bacterium]|nr:isocitrate lyase/phosphoenolpyruvate mutase family protein [Candidatus Baltobacteraceae bacterium]